MTWNLDPAHSGLQFAVKHMVISTVRGSFGEFAVDAEIDEANLANSRGDGADRRGEPGDRQRGP